MRTSLGAPDLARYVARQLNGLFPDRDVRDDEVGRYVGPALDRVDYCFSRVRNKYFVRDGEAYFNHLHTDQYAIFLYYLSNSVYRLAGDETLASKVYALNKALHGLDVFYEVALPDVFYLQHPVGTVLGRGHYSNYLVVYQRCSVGGNLDHVYPTLGEGVVMYGGSAIIGECTVGDNSWLSAGTLVMDATIPPGSVVFGASPALVIKPTRRDVIRHLFGG